MDEDFLPAPAGRLPRRRPMVGLCAALVAGVSAGILAGAPGWLWLLALFLLLFPLFLLVRRPAGAPLLYLAVALLGAADARIALEPGGARSLSRWMSRKAEYFRFTAVATEDARPDPSSGDRTDAVFRARLSAINRDGTWRVVSDPVRVILHEPLPDPLPRYGERWSFSGRVETGRPRRSGLFALPENRAIVEGPRAVRLSSGHGFFLKSWCMERRRAARRILTAGLGGSPEIRGILQALMLGYREELPQDRRREFADTGTIHIFAISGAHVGIVSVLLLGLLRMLAVPRPRQLPFLAAALLLYVVMTGAATSALRAWIMAVACLAAPACGRRPDAPSALAFAALLILLFAPLQLGDLGFLLSFTAVATLCALVPPVHAWISRHRPPPLRPRDYPGVPVPLLPRIRRTAVRWTWAGIAAAGASAAAWLGTAPLTAAFFNIFSPVALLLNIAVIPAAACILLSGALSLAVHPFSAFLSETFNFAALGIGRILVAAIRAADSLPFGHFFVRTPPPLLVAAAYAVLFAGALLARRRPRVLLPALLLLALLAGAFALRERLAVRLVFFPAGDGNALLVHARGDDILVDAGPGRPPSAMPRALRREGVNRLAAVVLTHADSDHTGALETILRETPAGEILVPAVLWPNTTLHARLDALRADGLPVRTLQAGDTGTWGRGAIEWNVLWPPAPYPGPLPSSDAASLVLRLVADNPAATSILLPADAPRTVEARLLDALPPDALASDILLLADHGRPAANSPGFLDAVRPRLAVLSAPENDLAPVPAPDTRAALDALSAPLLRIHDRTPLVLTLHSLPFLPPFTTSPD